MEEVDYFRGPGFYSYEPIPLMKRLKRMFRALDIYALPITLRYKMEKRFYTNFGALSSVILLLVVVVFIYLEVSVMFQKTQVSETSQTGFITDRPENIAKTLVPFSFGFRLINAKNQDLVDPSYLSTTLQ